MTLSEFLKKVDVENIKMSPYLEQKMEETIDQLGINESGNRVVRAMCKTLFLAGANITAHLILDAIIEFENNSTQSN